MKLIILAKCSDACSTGVPELGLEKNGYVPRGLGIGGGDYINFTVDTNTGKIEGWRPLTKAALENAFPKSKQHET